MQSDNEMKSLLCVCFVICEEPFDSVSILGALNILMFCFMPDNIVTLN